MKVIHLISGGDTGGAKTHVHYLLSGLCKKIDVTLVCFMRGDFSDEAQALGIPTVILEEGNILRTLSTLKKMIKAGGYGLIHSHGSRANLVAALLQRSCALPMITTVHSDPKLDYLGRPAARLVYGTLNSYALHRATYMVGVSDSMRELLIKRKFPANSIFSIYNGVDFGIEPKNDDRLAYLRGIGLDVREDSVVVGIVARLDPVKDVATLIRGFASAAKNNSKLRLAIAGEGGERQSLEKLAVELGVGDKVGFAGWLSDVNSFYAALDINVLCSLSETFPYALTEGARAKLATVSTRVGGVPRLIKNGETGFLFSVGDFESLAEKLTLLAEDAELRKCLGNAIYERARRDYSVEATTARQLDIYEEVLRRQKLAHEGKRSGVIVCGAYGMGNAGDDAILEAIVGELRELDPFIPITALSRKPGETRRRFGIESSYMFNIPAFCRVMKKTKLYISGGGSLIQNVTSRRSLWYYLHTIKTAKKLGNSIMMYGCGIGPVVDKRDEKGVKRILNECVDVITLREDYSRRELKKLDVTEPKIIVSSDPALTLPKAAADRVDEVFKNLGLAPDGRYVCFSVRSWSGLELKTQAFAAAADFAAEELEATPVFMIMNRKEDELATASVRCAMKNKSVLIGELEDSAMTIGVLSRMMAMVSMRLHGLIFAASTGVPLVGVSYDPKVGAFLESVGTSLCLPLEDVTDDRLCDMLSKAVDSWADEMRRRNTVEQLIASEKQNIEWAGKLLEL